MTELLLAYLGYNVVVGIILTAYYLLSGEGELKPIHIAWLLLHPASGLGNWRFQQQKLQSGQPEFPEKWYMWKYMVQVHWGFMAILAFGPAVLLILSALGVIAGGVLNTQGYEMSVEEMKAMIGAGLIAIGILYVIVMFFLLIIPYLLLIVLPKSQQRSIERQLILAHKRAQTAPPTAKRPMAKPVQLFRDVHIYVLACLDDFKGIPSGRKKELESVAQYIAAKQKDGESVNLTFICTHNSRRSQFGQVWAAVAAAHYGIRNVQCFSGGTEETNFNKRAVETLRDAGLKIEGTVGTNPRYSIRFSDEVGALDCFSKTFDHGTNPQRGFAAIMTCSDADENCPLVPGAETRFRLTYDDPKVADRTTQEVEVYAERSKQIATEMLYLFSKVQA